LWGVRNMDIKEKFAVTALAFAGVLSFLVVVAHAAYLGFDFSPGIPALLGGVTLVALVFLIMRVEIDVISRVTARKTLLIIIAIGAVLRVFMMLNPSASLDEWTFFSVVERTNPLNLVSFIPAFNQISGIPWTETTFVPFALLKLGYFLSPTVEGIRLFPVIMNISLIPISYYLAKEFVDERVAQFAAFLFAVNPGVIFFLDAADTDVFLVFFGMAGLLLFIRGYKSGSLNRILLSGLLFGLAFWSKTSFPYLWLAVAVLFVFAWPGPMTRSKKILCVALVILVAIGTFLPWAVVDPQAFNQSFVAAPLYVVGQIINPTGLSPGGSGTTIGQTLTSTTTGTTSAVLTITATGTTSVVKVTVSSTTTGGIIGAFALPNIIPKLSGAGWYTSIVDVFAQVPLWFGPIVVILGILYMAYGLLKKQERRIHVWLLIWVLLILIPLFSLNRDIRYFIDVASFPVVLLGAKAVGTRRTDFTQALKVLLVLSAVVFLVLGFMVSYQLNSGVGEAVQFVNQNFEHPTVLVSYPFSTLILSTGDNVSYLPSNVQSLNATISNAKPDVVIVWNQARTATLDAQYLGNITAHFRHNIEFGLSDYSYAIVYYNKTG
jgi:4-amino-4-deoxy-L-arabinose transferase-like glycosyltransferase